MRLCLRLRTNGTIRASVMRSMTLLALQAVGLTSWREYNLITLLGLIYPWQGAIEMLLLVFLRLFTVAVRHDELCLQQ